jgi:hypothetical protein
MGKSTSIIPPNLEEFAIQSIGPTGEKRLQQSTSYTVRQVTD